MKTVYVYVQNTMADWEPGFATAELNTGRFFRPGIEPHQVRTMALTAGPVVTLGGARILPELTVEQITPDDAALLILPGADTWLEADHEPVLAKVRDFLAAQVPVAAICGATLALAQAGILDNRRHTSNDLDFLRSVCPSYKGAAYYQHQVAVTDGLLITASGVAALEFAYHIFARLDVFRPETLEAWYNLHKRQEGRYYYDLLDSLGISPA